MIPETAFLAETLFSGFISKIINNGIDVSWQTIRQAEKSRKTKNSDKYTEIYSIIVAVLNQMTDYSYAEQDCVYQAAENILKGCRENTNKMPDSEMIKAGLKVLFTNDSGSRCREFTGLFYKELTRDEHNCLYKELLLSVCCEKEYSKEQLQQIEKKLSGLTSLFNGNQLSAKSACGCQALTADRNPVFYNNKKQDYIDKWNDLLFLHKNADERPLTLSDVFIMPQFKICQNTGCNGFSGDSTVGEMIRVFISQKGSSCILLKGVPGIGKSSMVSWIANEYKEDDSVLVLRFRDWEREDLERGLLQAVLITLGCRKYDLENKVLVMDGFDEFKQLNERDSFISDFLTDAMDIKNFKLLITSRPNYIDESDFQYVFEIFPLSRNEIKRYYQLMKGTELQGEVWNTDVLGIPVILYMAVMSEMDITKKTSKSELYGLIFAENKGKFYHISAKIIKSLQALIFSGLQAFKDNG